MADLKKIADDLTTKAALEAGKGAAKRAIEDLLSSDSSSSEEERAKKDAEEAALAKRKRTKYIAFGVVGLLLALGVIGMVVSYWQWFFLFGLMGLAALYGRYRWRKRRAGKDEEEAEEKVAAKKVEPESKVLRIDDGEARRNASEDRARDARAMQEARAEEEQAIDDELAAMKARLKK